jgi:tubulin--tyrosine ligase
MVNLAHRIYDPINLKDANSFKPEQRYKFFLGKGNNYLLVKSLLKRRFWWTV